MPQNKSLNRNFLNASEKKKGGGRKKKVWRNKSFCLRKYFGALGHFNNIITLKTFKTCLLLLQTLQHLQ